MKFQLQRWSRVVVFRRTGLNIYLINVGLYIKYSSMQPYFRDTDTMLPLMMLMMLLVRIECAAGLPTT